MKQLRAEKTDQSQLSGRNRALCGEHGDVSKRVSKTLDDHFLFGSKPQKARKQICCKYELTSPSHANES